MNKIYPYGKDNSSLILKGSWEWGANWEFFHSYERPSGLLTTSAICILLCEEGIVLTKTIKGGWELTGGRCNIYKNGEIEPVYDALKREVKEESGACLDWFTEAGVKVIYNLDKNNIVYSESGMPFPQKAFQEYFIGWCSLPLSDYTGEEVLDTKIFHPKLIDKELLNNMPEPFEFLFLLDSFLNNYTKVPLEIKNFAIKYKDIIRNLKMDMV